MAAKRVLRPPPRIERAEAILGRVDLPVQLRREVIEPALAQPLPRIGVCLTERVEPVDALRVAGTPDAKWADADGDPRLCDMHALIERRDEIVDVVTTPVVAIGPMLPAPVLDPRRVIRKIELVDDLDRVAMTPAPDAAISCTRLAIGIEEIVEVHAVDIVALDDVDDRRHHGFACLRDAGIDPLLPAIPAHPIPMLPSDVIARGANAAIERGAEGIEPRVHLDAAGVRLANRDGKRIVAGIDALMSRELGRPRRERRRIERIAAQPDVKDDGVEADRARMVEQCNELALLLFGGKSRPGRPVAVRRGTQPGTAKFAIDDRREDRAVAEGHAGHVA